jgi:exodeoxyribonuclease VII small subunit
MSDEEDAEASAQQGEDGAGGSEQGVANPARFEEALAELEKLVEHLEGGDLSLEDSLSHFERGVNLARECRDSLSAAEQKVQLLLERDGGGELTDFDPDGAAGDS